MVFETILTKHLKNAFFSGHALANVLAVTDAKLDNTSLSTDAADYPAKNHFLRCHE